MKKINKVGLEAEFFLHNKSGLIYPQSEGFGHDDYIILGEFRADPGETREEVIANFIKELVKVRGRAKQKGLTLSYGYEEITPKFKSEILKKMGSKTIQDIRNINKVDILNCTDDVVQDGKLVSSKVSAGLHVHFSKEILFEKNVSHTFEKQTQSTSVKESYYTLTPRQIKEIIVGMDTLVYPVFTLPVKLKYRQKGFYELKPYGFEYRSLPMVKDFEEIAALECVVNHAFNLLEGLDK